MEKDLNTENAEADSRRPTDEPVCPDCGGPTCILAPNGSEIPPGYDALAIMLWNPLTGPLAFLTGPWWCKACKSLVPNERVSAEIRSLRRRIGGVFVLAGIGVVILILLVIGLLGSLQD